MGCATNLKRQTFLGDVVAGLNRAVLPLPVLTPLSEEPCILQAIQSRRSPHKRLVALMTAKHTSSNSCLRS